MKKYFVAFLSLLFLLEGSQLQWLLPQSWGSPFVIVPQLVVSGIVAISFYLPRRYVLLISFVFGLLHDIVYGPAIGIQSFTLPLVAYGAYLLSGTFSLYQWIAGMTLLLGQLSCFLVTYGWYRLFGFTDVSFSYAFWIHMVPSVMFNLLVGYPIYRLIRWIYQKKRTRSVIFDTILR
ncbi:rod shape-determining protein MreD [Thermoactinomyces mirandus]|uniref:Rod shape-determining protein MreD n=1 Tax=Thermoactinomyces mirandus TaxID=2756294 RepID=A0A7W2AR82_9BACL|nr:rod shape-determining protein MreD [Thermoactinomyces mirandus]MBA4602719.1 rod shape-determining protein MreD [Thermoactinomyces mirandus]